MTIALGSDHAGYEYKCRILDFLRAAGHSVTDFGTYSSDPVDYPDFIGPAAEAVSSGLCERGIVLGGSGNGEAIAANKFPGIRCAVAWDLTTARLSRLHNDANMLSLGQRTIPADLALQIVEIWLDTAFEGGRHVRRLAGISAIEARYSATRPAS